MKRINLFTLLFVLVIHPFTLASGQSPKGGKKEKIVGTVIANYTSGPPCVWHPCAVWLIVRGRDDVQRRPRYVQVSVEYFPSRSVPNRGFPTELVEKAKEWRFTAVRANEPDEAVERYLTIIDSESGEDMSKEMAAPAWALLPGAENERIPFGEILPTYYVKASRFKPHRNSKK